LIHVQRFNDRTGICKEEMVYVAPMICETHYIFCAIQISSLNFIHLLSLINDAILREVAGRKRHLT